MQMQPLAAAADLIGIRLVNQTKSSSRPHLSTGSRGGGVDSLGIFFSFLGSFV
jgi:hypothetical protein